MSQETLNPEDYRQSPTVRQLSDEEISEFVKSMYEWDYTPSTRILSVHVNARCPHWIKIDLNLCLVTSIHGLIQIVVNTVSKQAYGFGEITGRSEIRDAMNNFLSGKSDKLDWKPSKG